MRGLYVQVLGYLREREFRVNTRYTNSPSFVNSGRETNSEPPELLSPFEVFSMGVRDGMGGWWKRLNFWERA